MGYFREKPYRIFYLGFFVLIYFSALLQAITPLGSFKPPTYLPEKVKIDLGKQAEGLVDGYFGENFFYPKGPKEGWMKNHGLLVLDNISPTNRKVALDFMVRSYSYKRVLRISLDDRVVKRIPVEKEWRRVKIPKLMLEPGETLIYFYTPEESQETLELLGKNRKATMIFRDFSIKLLKDYTFREKSEIAKQKIFNFVNNINYVYLTLIAFISLLIAFIFHIYSALSSESIEQGNKKTFF